MDKLAMAILSITLLFTIYRIAFVSHSPSNPFFIYLTLTLSALGTIRARDFNDPPSIRIMARSSTDHNDHSASLDDQVDTTKSALEAQGARVEDVVRRVESGNTMDRESLSDFLDDVKTDDTLDGLGLMEVDRLTRADPFETIRFYSEMKERDALLFVSSLGFIDWGDLNDINQLLNQTVFARRWYLRIKQGSAGSIISDINDGKYPGKTPVGFETDEDHNIWVKEDEREFIYRTFKTYLREENRAETRRQMNDWRRKCKKEELSQSQYKTLLTSPMVKGHLTYKDQVINAEPELQVVDEDTFRRAQEIRRARKPSQTSNQDFPDFVARAGKRYGIEYIISILESFNPQCRKCGGELIPNGNTGVLDVHLQSYVCVDCGHQGPLIDETEIQELHQTAPLRCPLCPATERFEVEEIPGLGEYRYTCRRCSNSFKHDSPPNKTKRAIDYPETKFEMNRSYDERENSNSSVTSGSTTGDDDDGSNMELTSF